MIRLRQRLEEGATGNRQPGHPAHRRRVTDESAAPSIEPVAQQVQASNLRQGKRRRCWIGRARLAPALRTATTSMRRIDRAAPARFLPCGAIGCS